MDCAVNHHTPTTLVGSGCDESVLQIVTMGDLSVDFLQLVDFQCRAHMIASFNGLILHYDYSRDLHKNRHLSVLSQQ
jgi:hypothetical protein